MMMLLNGSERAAFLVTALLRNVRTISEVMLEVKVQQDPIFKLGSF